MKKILVCLICFIIFSPLALASKETDEVKKILPYKYERVRKIKADNKVAYAGENVAFISLYSPDGLYDDFMQTYYSQNNKLQNIKFENYPDEAVIRYKQSGKYGIIYVQGNIIHITKPVFEKVEFPDDNSIAAKMLNVSFAPLDNIILYAKYPYRNRGTEYLYQSAKMLFSENPFLYHKGYVFLNPAKVEENIRIENNNLYVKYERILFPQSDYAIVLEQNNINLYELKTFKKIEYNNINLSKITQMPIIDSFSGLYEFIDKNTAFDLSNYPLEGMIKIGNKLYMFKNGQMQRLEGIYDDFQLTGDDLYINRLTGLHLSYQADNNIIAKRLEKWGIVNSEGKIKVPFVYDEVYAPYTDIEENITNIKDINAQKLELSYICQEAPSPIYIARNGKKYGVINENNEILVPFEYVKYSEDNDLSAVKNQIGITMQKETQRQNRKEALQSLPWFISSIILYPLWLIVPCASIHIDINY